MTATIIDPVAQALTDIINGLGVHAIAGEMWDPGMGGMDSLPRGVVGIPRINRTPSNETESQMGSDDWTFEFPVGLYFDLSEAKFSQQQAVDTVQAFITAVDTNPSLSDPTIVDDAVVLEAEPVQYLDGRRPMLGYECRVAVTKLVPSPY